MISTVEKSGCDIWRWGPSGSWMAGNCTENMAPYFKQRICDDWLLFSSDKYLIFKSSLVGRNLHFPSLQNAFRHPHTQFQTCETSQEVWAFPLGGRDSSAAGWVSPRSPVSPSAPAGWLGWAAGPDHWAGSRRDWSWSCRGGEGYTWRCQQHKHKTELRTTALARHLIHALSEKSTFVMLSLWKETSGFIVLAA